jgi:hypothetical protein
MGRKRDRERSHSEDSSSPPLTFITPPLTTTDDLVTWEDPHGSSQEDSDGSEYHGGGEFEGE